MDIPKEVKNPLDVKEGKYVYNNVLFEVKDGRRKVLLKNGFIYASKTGILKFVLTPGTEADIDSGDTGLVPSSKAVKDYVATSTADFVDADYVSNYVTANADGFVDADYVSNYVTANADGFVDADYVSNYVTANADGFVDGDYVETYLDTRITEKDKSGKLCFIMDDGYTSLLDTALDESFETRGYGFGIAVNGDRIGNANYLDTAELLDLQSRGFEILNHTADHTDLGLGVNGHATARAAILDHHTALEGLGLNAVGFVAAYSIMDPEYIQYASGNYPFAFTTYRGDPSGLSDINVQINYPPFNPYLLHRAQMYANGVADCKTLIDHAIATNSFLCLYDHDPSQLVLASSMTAPQIVEVLDYAISAGIDIINPSEITQYFSTTVGNTYRGFISGGSNSGRANNVSVLSGDWVRLNLRDALTTNDLEVEQNGTFKVLVEGVYDIEVAMRINTSEWIWFALNLRPDDALVDNGGNGSGAPRNRVSSTNNLLSYKVSYPFKQYQKFGIDFRANGPVSISTIGSNSSTAYSWIHVTRRS